MASNIVNQQAYLRTSREFPDDDVYQLALEVNKAYVDTSNAINYRTIGMFPTKRPAINGESWFITSARQQGFRQVYPFTQAELTASGGVIPHRIKNFDNLIFTRIYGTFTDGSVWYPLPYVNTAGGVASQISLSVDSTNINVTEGGGGSQPVVDNGYVVLEWISRP